MNEPAIPPEWEARPDAGPTRVLAWAPLERHEWVRAALAGEGLEIDFVRSAEQAAAANADMAIISHEFVAMGNPGALARCLDAEGDTEPRPIVVVIDAPEEARVRYQRGGADIAAGRETSARELGARICALLRRARMERDRSTLTGLPGNRALRRRLVETLERGQTVALTMADIDDFKAFNDTHGHLAGDALICMLADALRLATRTWGAFLAHVGGDDFAIICGTHEAAETARAAEAEFARRREDVPGEERPQVTIVSTTVAPEEAEGLDAVFRRLARLRRVARGGGNGRSEE